MKSLQRHLNSSAKCQKTLLLSTGMCRIHYSALVNEIQIALEQEV